MGKKSKKILDPEALQIFWESELKYQTLFENATDAIFIIVKELFVDCNKAALELFAGSKKQLLGSSIVDFLPSDDKEEPQDLALLQERINQSFAGVPQHFEIELCRLDKKCIHAEVNMSSFTLNKEHFVQVIVRDISKTNQHKIALQKSESLFKGVINASQDALIGIDKKGICFLFNPAAEKMFLQKENEIIGKSLNSIIPEKYKELHKNGVKNIFKSHDFSRLADKLYYVEAIRSNGTEFPAEISFFPVTIEENIFIIGSVRDISKRIIKENALKESEKKFRQLFRDMPDAIYIVSQGGKSAGQIVDVNLAAQQQSGYSRDELLHMNILSHLCADSGNLSLIADREKQVNLNGTAQFIEKKIRKDRTEYWSEVLLTSISYNNSSFLLSINRDVTDKIATNEKIIKLSYAVEQNPAFIMITDVKGKIEYANKKALDITGFTQDELIGKNFRYENLNSFPKEEFKKLWSTLATQNYWRSGFEITNIKNEKIYVSATVSSIKNDQNIITNYIGIIEDRTEQMRLQMQLNQAQKMESIGTLTGGIAHDFNNLLTVINGYSELASNIVTENEKAGKYFKAIFKAGEKAARLVSQLLAFTRQQTVEIEVLDINTVIGDLNKMIGRLIGANIHIETALEPNLPYILADPGQIEQILINLVVNARDAINASALKTSDRQISIQTELSYLDNSYIKTHTNLEEGAYVLFTVGDNGSGMTEEVRNRIFDPFFTTKEEGKGTGLGLATVYGIVNQNKGDIQVYSKPGKGTTFKIYWPVSKSSLQSKPLKEKKIESAINKEHILLVDDDNDVRTLSAEMLAKLNYNITEAQNGVEALNLLQNASCRPNLIITDLIMPEMDGIEFAQKAKQLLPEIKILYASGFADNRFKEHNQVDLEKYFIQKPYTLYSIANKVYEILYPHNA